MVEPCSLSAEIEAELDKLKITRTQRQLIANMGDSLGESLGMSTLSMRGFYSKALIAWQKKIKMTTAESESRMSTSPTDRIRSAEEILAILREMTAPVVRSQGREDLLDGAISTALNLCTDEYSDRPPDPE